MNCNLSKIQALPMALRVSSPQPICSNQFNTTKLQSFSHGVYPKPSLNPSCTKPATSCAGFSHRGSKSLQLPKPTKGSIFFCGYCVGFALPNSQLKGIRCLSNMYNAAGGNGRGSARRALPWLDESKVEDSKRVKNVAKAKDGGNKSSWEVSAEKFLQKSGVSSSVQDEGRRIGKVDVVDNWQKPRVMRGDSVEEEDGETEVIKNPKWDRIKTRLRPVVNARGGFRKPEMQRWNKQEDWGRKTFREASESSVPKMVGEGIYGVGPVLAALSAGRREFYTLYVQEGLELSKNNKKKKDKKGFEKVLKIAEKMSLSLREVSKHDLNMVSDNRPHQGLVLDASPLEMVSIKELEPISAEHDKGVLWVALDEVTDPQNLGAIIRSSYFFGASGVILCAENSAPLSGVVSKASAGSLELMELRSCKNMMQFLTSSAENGWRVLGGSVSSRAVPLREIVPGEPTILVLGSEGTGLRPLVERSCTELVRIPGNIPVDISVGKSDDLEDADTEHQCSGEEFRSFMAVESLNVSVAAGVLLHHLIGDNYTSGSADSHSGYMDTDALD